MYTIHDHEIDALLSKMSLREKVGQLNQVTGPLRASQVDDLKASIRKGEIGSLILASSATAGNDPQGHVNVALYNELQRVAVEESPNHIPMLYGRDVIHGHRTVYPIPLANAAVMLATAPKSNTAYSALAAANADIAAGRGQDVPKHLRSPNFVGYKYPHDYENDWVAQQYLPDDLKNRHYYEYGNNKTEQSAKQYWEKIKNPQK